jgi:hypothetical protein
VAKEDSHSSHLRGGKICCQFCIVEAGVQNPFSYEVTTCCCAMNLVAKQVPHKMQQLDGMQRFMGCLALWCFIWCQTSLSLLEKVAPHMIPASSGMSQLQCDCVVVLFPVSFWKLMTPVANADLYSDWSSSSVWRASCASTAFEFNKTSHDLPHCCQHSKKASVPLIPSRSPSDS